MGQTKMGKYDFSSWTLHMASIIIFATLWAVLREWHGTSMRTKLLVTCGLLLLVGSTVIVGYGNYIHAVKEPNPSPRCLDFVCHSRSPGPRRAHLLVGVGRESASSFGARTRTQSMAWVSSRLLSTAYSHGCFTFASQ